MNLQAKWLVAHKKDFPWQALLGGTLVSNDGSLVLVSEVLVRPWPLGPLFTINSLDELKPEKSLINILPFESGNFIEVKAAPSQLLIIRAFQQVVEASIAKEDLDKALEEQALVDKAIKLDQSRQFDLLLFDLDDTLVLTAHLDNFRGRENVDNKSESYKKNLSEKALSLKILIPETLILEIKKNFPSLKLGIFTRAPAEYTKIVLEACFPNIQWDCKVTFETAKAKPSPEGIVMSARSMGISNFNRIAFVGDDEHDVCAAYQAGCYSVLFRKGWRGSVIYKALALHSDAMIDDPLDIINLLIKPKQYLLTLESCEHEIPKVISRRVDEQHHFNNSDEKKDDADFVKIYILGRYFSIYKPDYIFDFSPKLKEHQLSADLLNFKITNKPLDIWVACIAIHIKKILSEKGSLMVCCIPAKPERFRRMEGLVDAIKDYLGPQDHLTFDAGVLEFKAGVVLNKRLDANERYKNIKAHLLVSNPTDVQDKNIFVLDDIVTTGYSFYWAERYLKLAGASSIYCCALAKSITGGG